jgi:hypothetical protein
LYFIYLKGFIILITPYLKNYFLKIIHTFAFN